MNKIKTIWKAREIWVYIERDGDGDSQFIDLDILKIWGKGHLQQDKLSGNWYLELNTEMIEALGLKENE